MNPATLDRLADAVADKIVTRLAERLDERSEVSDLVDAAEIARRFGVAPSFVYEHADELGAIRLGDGDRPRLRFDPQRVFEGLAARPTPASRSKPRRRRASSADLLPVKGER